MELTDIGFDHSVLSEFRTRLLIHGAEQRVFDTVLTIAHERGRLKAGGRQRSDSTHVLGAMRAMTRLDGVTETLRHALNILATQEPPWLRAHTTADWVDRYGLRASAFRLPKRLAKRQAWAEHVGRDGKTVLIALDAVAAPSDLHRLPAVETLRRVWIQNFLVIDGKLVWRDNDMTPPAGHSSGSPNDVDARYATKRHTQWVGYKIHLTETYGDEQANSITNVETTHAAVSDDAVTETIHASLAQHQLLPEKHVADTGYVNAPLFVRSKATYGVELIGPTRGDNHWQAKEGLGYAARDVTIDWEHEQARCPVGKVSNSWTPAIDRFKNEVIKITFKTTAGNVCLSREKCTRSTPPRRTMTVRRQAHHEALLAGRTREQTEQCTQAYANRAGVEGTIAQRVRTGDVRRARYVGQAKTHLQH